MNFQIILLLTCALGAFVWLLLHLQKRVRKQSDRVTSMLDLIEEALYKDELPTLHQCQTFLENIRAGYYPYSHDQARAFVLAGRLQMLIQLYQQGVLNRTELPIQKYIISDGSQPLPFCLMQDLREIYPNAKIVKETSLLPAKMFKPEDVYTTHRVYADQHVLFSLSNKTTIVYVFPTLKHIYTQVQHG